jgi:hypothetical protein
MTGSRSPFGAANQALAEASLELANETPIKRMAEILIEGIGSEAIKILSA